MLINLLVNARDAMPEGGRLELSSCERRIETQEACTRGLPSAGRYVEISVADEGEGMSEETRSRIFEPFFTTKDVGKGTGLGLQIVHRIVRETHKGEIAVESKPGETRFRIRLPISTGSPER